MIERIVVALCRSWKPDVGAISLPSSPPSLFFIMSNRMPILPLFGGGRSDTFSAVKRRLVYPVIDPLPNRSCSYLASYESFSSVIWSSAAGSAHGVRRLQIVR
jgi:hypothetical protein